MDNYRELKEIIEKQAALNHKLAAMALELDTERAKNASLCKEVSRSKSLIGESGQELWSAENQRADWLEAELEQVKLELDAAKGCLAAYEDTGLEPEEIRAALEGATREFMVYDELGQIGHLRELVQAEQDGRLVVLPCFPDETYWQIHGDVPAVPRFDGICIIDSDMNLFYQINGDNVNAKEIGKTVFLTREEAEAVLTAKGEHDG